ncbi:glycosyltransferase [Vineibacter terrae]|uniref:Glycosyltransferase n=1 Tax=Vineibacter terrae TaxID=2586908 RepID=A0A5C8PEU5_9HYPH|nr:glycosyltransferase [Vineibacter terrae]TXL72289.1 glycosyltransferase [Vineibacter terrae]
MSFSHTFVVPSYNQADFIGKTIESLLRQDLPGSEIVVSEDFSNDHTMQVLTTFGDRIRIVRPPEHRGMAFNWNWGVSQARTDWVSIMGADDLALPHFVRTLQAGVRRNPGTVLASGDVEQIDGAGTVVRSDGTVTARPVTHPPDTFYRLLAANRVQVAAHCFRRDAWEKVGGFETRLRLYGDWGLWLKLAPLGDFVHVRKVIAQYRIAYRPGIAKQRLPESLRDDADVQCLLIPEVAKAMHGVNPQRLRKSSRQRFHAVLAEAAAMLSVSERGFAVDLLRDWARGIGADKQLEAFAAGRPLSSGWQGSAMRRGLRQLYRTLRPAR